MATREQNHIMKYIAYYPKDPIVFPSKTANGIILRRFECGMNITPQPKEDEEFLELENEKAIIFPSSTDKFRTLILRVHKHD